jgi:hypothetical protein
VPVESFSSPHTRVGFPLSLIITAFLAGDSAAYVVDGRHNLASIHLLGMTTCSGVSAMLDSLEFGLSVTWSAPNYPAPERTKEQAAYYLGRNNSASK